MLTRALIARLDRLYIKDPLAYQVMLTRALIAICALAILFGLIVLSGAQARDPSGKWADAPHSQWYKSQHNASGLWCCDESDAHPYYGDYTLNPDGSVTVEGEKIEKYKVLTGPNPTGHAVWWFVDAGGGRLTYCFAVGGGV